MASASQVLGSAQVEITANLGPLRQNLQRAEQMVRGFAASASMLSRVSVGSFLGGAALAGVGAAVAGFQQAVTAASDLNEALHKTQVIFGKASETVVKDADGMASRFGVVKKEYLDAAGSIGNLLQQTGGMGEEEAAKLSKELTQAALDASSAFDTSFQDAAGKVEAAIRGVSEPIAAFGVDTQNAAVKQNALANGAKRLNGELSTQEQVAARARLVLQGLSVVRGDRGNTGARFAIASREIFGRIQNTFASLGASFLPVAERFLGIVNRMLAGLGNFVSQSKPQIDAFVAKFMEIAEYVAWIANEVGSALAGLTADLVAEVTSWDVYKAAVEVLGQTWEWLKDVAAEVFETIGVVWRNWSSIVAEGTIRAKQYIINFGELFSWLLNAAGTFIGWFAANWKEAIIDSLTSTVTIIENLGINFYNLFQAIADWAQGKGFHFNFKPLLDGFKTTMSELPEIAKPTFTNLEDEIKDIRVPRGENIAQQEDEQAKKPSGKEGAAAPPVRGQRQKPGEFVDQEKAAQAAEKRREANERVEDAMIRERRAREDLEQHFNKGGGEFKSLTQFAQDIQSGALSQGDFQSKTLRLQEDLYVAMREVRDAIDRRNNLQGGAGP